LNSRAIVAPGCATGFQNPDTGACTIPADVHWIEGAGLPNASTVGRNTLRTAGTNNFDLNLTKSIPWAEKRRLELRWEALNAFNLKRAVQPHSVMPFRILRGLLDTRDERERAYDGQQDQTPSLDGLQLLRD
jgi:hypothetical protein